MNRINVIGIDTSLGYRTVELLEGDITALEDKVDMLVVSAYAGDYKPVPGTVLWSLRSKYSIDLKSLIKNASLDLRSSLSLWISDEISSGPSKRLMCVEILGTDFDLADIFNNVFAALILADAKDIPIRTVAMPLIGTGLQNLAPDKIAKILVSSAHKYLEKSYSADKLQFIEIDSSKVQVISNAMDEQLGRVRVSLPHEHLSNSLRADVRNRLMEARDMFIEDSEHLWHHWISLLDKSEVRSTDFGVAARKLVEAVLNRLGIPPQQLFKRIRALEQTGQVAPWICGYMHVLRHLGNESAHSHDAAERQPPVLEPADMIAGLFCVERILEFWISGRSNRKQIK